MCSTTRDLCECLTYLMWFVEEDVLETSLLEPEDDQKPASPTPEEETALFGESQEAHAMAACPPKYEEWAPEPENAANLREAATEPQGE